MTAALEGSEWSAARPGRTLPPGKDPVPILQEAGYPPGPVWTGGKSHPHRDSIPDRAARSSLAIPTELPGPLIDIHCVHCAVRTEFLYVIQVNFYAQRHNSFCVISFTIYVTVALMTATLSDSYCQIC